MSAIPTYFNTYNIHNFRSRYCYIVTPIFKWENRDTERFSNLSPHNKRMANSGMKPGEPDLRACVLKLLPSTRTALVQVKTISSMALLQRHFNWSLCVHIFLPTIHFTFATQILSKIIFTLTLSMFLYGLKLSLLVKSAHEDTDTQLCGFVADKSSLTKMDDSIGQCTENIYKWEMDKEGLCSHQIQRSRANVQSQRSGKKGNEC